MSVRNCQVAVCFWLEVGGVSCSVRYVPPLTGTVLGQAEDSLSGSVCISFFSIYLSISLLLFAENVQRLLRAKFTAVRTLLKLDREFMLDEQKAEIKVMGEQVD